MREGVIRMNTRYDVYEQYKNKENLEDSPCVIYDKIRKEHHNCGTCANWHENLEIQLCIGGEGYVLIGGERYDMEENRMVIVNTNQIHYTGTETELTYYPMILDTEFCKRADIDCSSLDFAPTIDSKMAVNLFNEVVNLYYADGIPFKKAKLQAALLNLLIELIEHHVAPGNTALKANNESGLSFSQVKNAIRFIREHYAEKLTLERIAKNSLTDKYSLSRKFKELTGQTVVQFISAYRCERTKELIRDGMPISEAAAQCGFNNMSFFTKIFKKYTARLPSDYKRK